MESNNLPTLEYRFRAPGSTTSGPVRYAIACSSRGIVLVGGSRHGVCAIFLGDDATALRAQLADAFPDVERTEDRDAVRPDLDAVIAFIDREPFEGVVALDVGGTAFQQRVWRALCAIPAGQTRSYREVADGLGVPRAVRAVASACAANVLAIVIPCHRVVRSDGSITGYRWGVERKRALLATEGA